MRLTLLLSATTNSSGAVKSESSNWRIQPSLRRPYDGEETEMDLETPELEELL